MSWTLSAPSHLRAEITSDNKVKLKWQYQVNTAVPIGFRIYRGTSSIDYGSAVAQVLYSGNGILRVVLPAIAVPTLFAVRAYDDTTEEANTDFISVSPASQPGWSLSAPEHLSAEIIEGEHVDLTWQYQTNTAPPDGFHLYSNGGSGAINYTTPIKTVAFDGNGSIRVILPAIAATTKYAVRAYQGTTEDFNTDFVSVSPFAALVEVTGDGITTWSEE